MNKSNSHSQDIIEIKKMMEQSSKFLSLSGLSGISAGIIAIIGGFFAYWILDYGNIIYDEYFRILNPEYNQSIIFKLIILGLIILITAVSFGIFFSYLKAKKNNLQLWDHTSKRLLINLLIPLITGGIFSILLIFSGNGGLIASATLIFYGLALVNGSKYTLKEIKYLGISEIILGLFATWFIYEGLIFWMIGFGILHIFYGTLMYFKYERKLK